VQAGVIAIGLSGLNNKVNPGEPLTHNMYTDFKNSLNLKKLPTEIHDILNFLEDSKELKGAFGQDTINSYIELKRIEIENFNQKENFDKESSVTEWEKNNTLDC
tara:strand:- start:65 stop:376 length:312 start_codon:yes stop_codon:yes gene_type:complete